MSDRPAHIPAAVRDWPEYFDRMEGKPPRETTTIAAKRLLAQSPDTTDLHAIDLGCGAGRDTEFLLASGFRVSSFDSNQNGLDRLAARPECREALARGTLSTTLASFEQLTNQNPPLPHADLVNASFSLPFCPPGHFEPLWKLIDAAIKPHGFFAGQFFGDRDDWATLEDRTHLSRESVLSRFDRYILESFIEEDRPSKHVGDAHKHWHVFHIVARKQPNHTTKHQQT